MIRTITMVEMWRRLKPLGMGTEEIAELAQASSVAAAYCLDAPDDIPAGSVVFSTFGLGPCDWWPEPTFIHREDLT